MDFSWMHFNQHDEPFHAHRLKWHRQCCDGKFPHQANSSEVHAQSWQYFQENINPEISSLRKNYLSLSYLFCNHLIARGFDGYRAAIMLGEEAISVIDNYTKLAKDTHEFAIDADWYEYVKFRLQRHILIAERHVRAGSPELVIPDQEKILHFVRLYGDRTHYDEKSRSSLFMKEVPKYKQLLTEAHSDICRSLFRSWVHHKCQFSQDKLNICRSYFDDFEFAFNKSVNAPNGRIMHLDTHFKVRLMRMGNPNKILTDIQSILENIEQKKLMALYTEVLILRETMHVAKYIEIGMRDGDPSEEIMSAQNSVKQDSSDAMYHGYETSSSHLEDAWNLWR
ncbi:hypothetical protein [Microcoleus sp. B7-D4]|uniref:hypothetical protein n=1 Tax=Microcoleus sp. B7-D4 TaxID=2818696 RepID=UPI002FD682D0